VKSQNGTIQFQYSFTYLKDWGKKQQSQFLSALTVPSTAEFLL